MIRAVIFDMDGVLVNTEPLKFRAYQEVFKNRFDIVLQDDPRRLGMHEIPAVEFFLKKYELDGDVAEIVREKRQAYYRILDKVPFAMFSGATELLAKLRADGGLLIDLATSSDRRSAAIIFKRFDLEKYFDLVLTQEDIEKKKPDPEIYLKSASGLKINPEECVVVEDSEVGVEAAKKAGMKCIAVTFTTSRNRLGRADLVIDELKQLTLEKIKSL